MRNDGYRVSLDGHGVDEMLFGYPHSLYSAYSSLMESKQSFLAEEVKQAYKGLFLPHVTPPSLKDFSFPQAAQSGVGVKGRVKQFIPKSALKAYHKLRKMNMSHDRSKENWMNGSYLNVDENKFYPGIDKLNEVDRSMFREFHITTLPTILRNFDRAAMQSGIEIRMPFMDWRLVSFVFSLPLSAKIGNGYTKLILRNAMSGIVPEQIRVRKAKVGFNAPMPMWFSNQLKTFINDEVNSVSFSNFGLWDSVLIREFVRERSKKGWSWGDCNRFWPYLNAYLITK